MYSYLDEERDIVLRWIEFSPNYLFFPLELRKTVTSVLFLRNISQDELAISFQIDLPFPLSMILELQPSTIGIIPFGEIRELQLTIKPTASFKLNSILDLQINFRKLSQSIQSNVNTLPIPLIFGLPHEKDLSVQMQQVEDRICITPSNASIFQSISKTNSNFVKTTVSYGLSMDDEHKSLPLSFFYFTSDMDQATIITALELQTTTPVSTCVNCNFVEVMSKSVDLHAKCPQCFDCPKCNTVLTHMENENRTVYFACQNCKWNSFQLQWIDGSLDGLLEKHTKRETKKQTYFQSLLHVYKQDSQHLKTEIELNASLKQENTLFKKSILKELHSKRVTIKTGLEERRFATVDDILLSIDKQFEMKCSANFDYHKLVPFDQLNYQPNESTMLLQERWPQRKHLLPFYCKHFNKKLIVKYGEVDSLQFSRNWNAVYFLPEIKVVEVLTSSIVLSIWNPRRNGMECELEIVKESGIELSQKKCKVLISSEILSALSMPVKQESPLVIKTNSCSTVIEIPCQKSEKFSFSFRCIVSEWNHTNLVKFKNSQELFVFVATI